MNYLSLLFLTLFVSGCAQERPISNNNIHHPDLIYVEIHKISEGKDIYVYGWVEEIDLRRLTAGQDTPKFIKVYHEHYFDDCGVTLLEGEEKSGVYYLKLDTLNNISEMNEVSIEKLRLQEKEAIEKRKVKAEKSGKSEIP